MKYKRFSEREGFEKGRVSIQVDSMDDALRNSLWNALLTYYGRSNIHPIFIEKCRKLWVWIYKKPIDELPTRYAEINAMLREKFFDSKWFEVYNIIEFFAKNSPDFFQTKFIETCNEVLKRELSAWRFVGTYLSRITEEQEIAEIEVSLDLKKPFEYVSYHIETSLKLISNKEAPDYRNSMKESISAVEAMCKMLLGDKNAKLIQLLKVLQEKINLHPSLVQAYDKIFGYTSDADGIRHALKEEENVDFEDAKFMLINCSAFINYLKIKASKAGIKIE